LRNIPFATFQFRVLPKEFARSFQIQLGFKKNLGIIFSHPFFGEGGGCYGTARA